jgi:hypothetical protein
VEKEQYSVDNTLSRERLGKEAKKRELPCGGSVPSPPTDFDFYPHNFFLRLLFLQKLFIFFFREHDSLYSD